VHKTKFNTIKDAIKTPIETAKTFVKEKFGEIVQWAKDLPGDIGKGIASFITDATDSIGDLADKLIKKFKKALGINSPSKVFTEMGGHIISGLINGLASGNLKDLRWKVVFSEFRWWYF
jgi:hypothetical protein